MVDFCSKVYCTYCQEEISGVRIQCCECIDFDICLQCFSAGAEIGSHRNDHSYKLFDHNAVSIFGVRGSWTGKEQLQLLDAVELYGFGNWQLISNHIDTRSPEECKEEYIFRYLEGNIGKSVWAQLVNHKSNLIDHTTNCDDVSQSLAAPLQCSAEEATVLGYRPYRDEYEGEYDMEAEEFVSRLQWDIEDNNIFTILNLGITDLYSRRLRDRFKRKRIARDYRLIPKYCQHLQNILQPATYKVELRSLKDCMIPFAQFLRSKEFERLVASIEREQELRQRLTELIKYRNLGLLSQEEILHYEQQVACSSQYQLEENVFETGGYPVQESHYKMEGEEMDFNFFENKSELNPEGEIKIKSNNSSSVLTSNLKLIQNDVPYGHMLSEQELKLCSSLKLNSLHYVTFKSLMIQGNLLGSAKKSINSLESQGTSIKEEIVKYLICSGWLPGSTS